MSWEWHRHRADHAPRAGEGPPRINVHPWPDARALSRRSWRSVTRMRRVSVDGDLGYSFGDLTRLTETTEIHPRLFGVDTIRLTAVPESTERLLAVGGVKWNLAARLLLNASVLRPLVNAGLNPQWVGAVALKYSLAR